MPIVDVNQFDAAVPSVQDTVTPFSAAGVNPMLQALANRTFFLKGVTDSIQATLAGLKAAAFMAVGTIAGTVAAGDHGHANNSNIGGPFAPANYLQATYPVGSIYANAIDGTNPATLFGFGTWHSYGPGRVMVSAGGGHSAGDVGGEETHVLTIPEMPAHTHPTRPRTLDKSPGQTYDIYTQNNTSLTDTTGSTGGGNAHNNMQPFIVGYVWQRIA